MTLKLTMKLNRRTFLRKEFIYVAIIDCKKSLVSKQSCQISATSVTSSDETISESSAVVTSSESSVMVASTPTSYAEVSSESPVVVMSSEPSTVTVTLTPVTTVTPLIMSPSSTITTPTISVA